jgi:hypothetical protein
VFVTQAELDLINEKRRRAMWLPVTRGTMNQIRSCPVEVGQLVGLQPRVGVAGLKVTVIEPPLLTTLATMTESWARLQGYTFLAHAQEAWERSYGPWAPDTPAWAIRFAVGDHTALWRANAERYLKAKTGGGRSYTTDPALAAHGEGAVPRADEMRFAAAAAARRDAEQQEVLKSGLTAIRRQIKRMRAAEATLDDAGRKDLRWLERRAQQMAERLAA